MVREWRCERATTSLNKGGDLLPELEGVDDARGLIEIEDGLVEFPPVVIHALLHCSHIRGTAVDLDAVVVPGPCSDMLISTPVWLSRLGYGGGGPVGLERRGMIHRRERCVVNMDGRRERRRTW